MRTWAPRSRAASSRRKKVTVRSLSKGGSIKAKVSVLCVLMTDLLIPDDFMTGEHGIDHFVDAGDSDVVLEVAVGNFALMQGEVVGNDGDTRLQELVECLGSGVPAGGHHTILHQQHGDGVTGLAELGGELVLARGGNFGKGVLTLYEQVIRHDVLPGRTLVYLPATACGSGSRQNAHRCGVGWQSAPARGRAG